MARDIDQPDPRLIRELVKRNEASAKRLRETIINPPGKSDGAQRWNQARAARILAQVDREIAALKKQAAEWTGPALQQAMDQGIAAADRQANQAGIVPPSRGGARLAGTFDTVDRGAAAVLARDTLTDLAQAAESMRDQARTALRRMAAAGVSNAEVNAILTGGVIEGHPVRAIRELREALAKVHGGKVTIMSKAGPMEFKTGYYAEMVARTKTREAVVRARHQRLSDTGIDLVVVTGRISANFCTAYVGKVFSISGDHPKYPPLSSLPGGGPPFHPNCSKGTAPFIEALADPQAIAAGEPDRDTNLMLNDRNQNSLQKKFEALRMGRQAQDRMKKIRPEAGSRVATHAGDDPTFQEHLIRELGVEWVQLNGRSDIGAVAVRGVQQVSAAGGSMPKAILARSYLDENGQQRADVPGAYDPRRRVIEMNTDWPGWRDIERRTQELRESGFWSSADPRHVLFHEAAHHHMNEIGAMHGRASFIRLDEAMIARKVSIRAGADKDEFMVEVRAAIMAGRRFDDDVMNLYRKMGGQ